MAKKTIEQLNAARQAAKAPEPTKDEQREAAVQATAASEPIDLPSIKPLVATNVAPPEPKVEMGLDDKIAMAVAKAMAAAAPAMANSIAEGIGRSLVAAESAKQMTEHDKRMSDLKKKQAKEERCHICGQSAGNGKDSGCGGAFARDPKTSAYLMEAVLHPDGTPARDADDKPMMRRIERPEQFHDFRVVFPNDPIAVQCWDGIKINGAIYQSVGPGHRIWVPKNLNIDTHLGAYEAGERDVRTPKVRNRNGGVINAKGAHSGPSLGAGYQ